MIKRIFVYIKSNNSKKVNNSPKVNIVKMSINLPLKSWAIWDDSTWISKICNSAAISLSVNGLLGRKSTFQFCHKWSLKLIIESTKCS